MRPWHPTLHYGYRFGKWIDQLMAEQNGEKKQAADADFAGCCEQRDVVKECRVDCAYGVIDDKKVRSMCTANIIGLGLYVLVNI